MPRVSYLENQTILRALEFTAAKKGFVNDRQRKMAATLSKRMKSNQSLSGRHQQLASMLKKGTTLRDMMKSAGSSRRTIFRYLNHFEEAGLKVNYAGGKYKLS